MATPRETREQEARVWALETLRIQRLFGVEESSLEDLIDEHMNFLAILRTTEGWNISRGLRCNNHTNIALTPDDLAEHVRKWALAQLED